MSRRQARRVVGIGAAVAISVTMIVAPLGGTAIAQEADDRVALRVGADDLVTASPWDPCCGGDWEMMVLAYDKLLDFRPEDLSAGPGLATECVPSDDHMTWTCTLRPGLRWSDGTPLTSRDVAFTYRFIIDNRIPVYRSYFPYNPTFETPDDTTLIWKAEEPTFAPIVPPYVFIMPEHVWAEYEGEGLKAIKTASKVPTVGSGPFILTEWKTGQFWRMERNPYYWGEEPVVDEVLFEVYSNEEAMVQALKNGEIDIAQGVIPSLKSSLEGEPNIKVHVTLSDWWLNLAFNFGGQGPDATNLPALHDLTVRQAIAHAIDKQAIADRVFLGTATSGDTVIRPASAFWHLDVPAEEEYAFDPELAAQMLEDAGHVDADGDGIREDPASGEPLNLEIAASQETTGAVDAGRLIDGMLEDVGIGVDLTPLSEGKMYDIWGTGDWDAYIWYWYGDPDPDFQLSVFTSDQCGGWSDGCYSDTEFDRLYEEQRGILEVDERLRVVQEAQRRLYEQVPGLVLAYPGTVQAYRTDRFTGWEPAPGPNGYLVFGYGPWSYLNLRPVSASASAATPDGTPMGVWIGIGAVILVALVVVVTRRRREEA